MITPSLSLLDFGVSTSGSTAQALILCKCFPPKSQSAGLHHLFSHQPLHQANKLFSVSPILLMVIGFLINTGHDAPVPVSLACSYQMMSSFSTHYGLSFSLKVTQKLKLLYCFSYLCNCIMKKTPKLHF